VTTSAVRTPLADSDRPGSASAAKPPAPVPLPFAAFRAACTAAGAGLAVMTILVLVGWIAAPHPGVGLIGVLRTAAVLWLIGHHVAVQVKGAGRIGMLPLGLVLMPGAMLWWAGRSLARGQRVSTPRQVVSAALSVAVIYALIAGALAILSQTSLARASISQAVLGGFVVAFVATWFGAARGAASWRRLGALMSARSRSILAGSAGSLAALAAAGFLTTAVALANHQHQFTAMYGQLDAGVIGAGLLLLAQVAYLPNAVMWSIAYMLGPGFAVGTGTVVSPTGSVLGRVPSFPLLTALPAAVHASDPGWLAATSLAVPYLAGAIGGLLVVRQAPQVSVDGAAIRGFCGGAGCGLVLGVLAGYSGGPLGEGRLSAVGPSAWQVTLVGVLELGIAAAVSAGAASWCYGRRRGERQPPPQATSPSSAAQAARAGTVPAGPAGPAGSAARPGGHQDGDGHVIFLDPWAANSESRRQDPPKHRRGPSSLP
jgi:hypothetical protein